MNIIQHHEPIDFEALLKQLENATIGLDGRDLEVFAADADEIHTFLGSTENGNRVSRALENVTGSDEVNEVIRKCKKFMLIIRHNPEAVRPVMMDEMSAISKFVDNLPEGNDIQWSLMQDSNLVNKVEVILLCNLKR